MTLMLMLSQAALRHCTDCACRCRVQRSTCYGDARTGGCCCAGDHIAVLPNNRHHINTEQLVKFGQYFGIQDLSSVFDLELLEPNAEGKPFPLPNTYMAVLSGDAC